MKNKYISRLLIDILLVISIIYGWWIFALIISLICLLYFPNFIEIIIFGLLFDALFGSNPNLGIYSYIGSLVSIVIFFIFYVLNMFLRK